MEGLSFMLQHPQVPVLWLGDFNNTLNPSLDRLHTSLHPQPTVTTTIFARLVSQFNLADTWRVNFSCYSPTHHSLSRIDYILMSLPLTSTLLDVGFVARRLSDHSPYWVSLQLLHEKPRIAWQLNPIWLSLLPGEEEFAPAWALFLRKNDGTAPPSAVWEAFVSC